MKWRTFEIDRKPGFRFNLIDLILITAIVTVTAVAGLLFPYYHLYFLPLYVGASFFLFCNVFRIGNRLEAFWYVPFLVITAFALREPSRFWMSVLGLCEPLRILVIVCSIRIGTYRGVFSGRP